MEVSGVIKVGESSAAMAYVKGRRGLSPRQMKFILLTSVMAIGIPASAWLIGSWLSAFAAVEAAVGGLLVGVFIVQGLSGVTMRRALEQRGQASEHSLKFALTADALVYDLGDLTMTGCWSSVTDVYRTRKYWVFLVQSSAMVLPRRFFLTPQDERSFIAEALSHMTEAAQARSPDAVNLADQG